MNIIQIQSIASRVIDALTEAGSQEDIEKVKAVVKEVQDAYFKEWNLPMPAIEVRNFTNPKWLGQMSTRIASQNPYERPVASDPNLKISHTLKIQKSIMGDQESLRRVVAHEMIHLWNNRTQPIDRLLMIARIGDSTGGHGQEFLDYAAKINAIVGSEYITPKSDETYKVEQTKDFYLLVEPRIKTSGGQVEVTGFGWSWAVRPSAQQKEEIRRRQVNREARLFKSKDPRWLRGVQIKKWGGYSYVSPSSPGAEEEEKDLKQMFISGQDIVLN